ncbi:hypothetical protein CK203_006832 [Vitis vinifera]|uniref:Uncharacterized protein n=1 Tax=Vitis vinifera TaxID=29760 RepID=A0A438KBY0_VITVI|nr:hypothetical protein CK203_006832 [Vitis vinifera]
MIRDLFDFRWPKPIKTDLAKWDRNRSGKINQGWALEAIRLHGWWAKGTGLRFGRPIPTTSTTPKVVISYIHGGPIDKKYNSKQKRQRLLHAIFVREWISFIQHNLPDGSTHPIDDIIIFPPINANRVNETPTIYPRKPRVGTIWIQWSHDDLSRRHCITCPSWSDHPKCAILGVEDLSHFNAIMRRVWPHSMKVIPSTEVEYSDWLANAVVIPKKRRKWRVYVNYTNLNDACPGDSFPLPE